MREFQYVVAEMESQIADAQRLRWLVYGEEERMLGGERVSDGRLLDECDALPETSHLLVYADGEAVGTARLTALSDAEPGDAPFRVEGLPADARRAVVGRYCVVRRYRGTRVVAALYSGLCAESRRRGVTTWLALANAQTDCQHDATIAYRVAEAHGYLSVAARASPEPFVCSPTPCRRHIYDRGQREQAAHGRFADLSLPPTLSLYVRRMGGRCVGPPVYDAAFGTFAFPLVAKLPD